MSTKSMSFKTMEVKISHILKRRVDVSQAIIVGVIQVDV